MTPPDRPAGPLHSAAVVVVNYGSHGLLETNLAGVSSLAPEASYVVVDNFSTSEEQERVAQLGAAKGWIVVNLATNSGFGNGVNAGVEAAIAAGCTSVLVLNPDASIARTSLERLISAVENDRQLMVAPVVRESNGRVWSAGSDVLLDDGRMSNPRRRPEREGRPYREWLSGACFAISTELWQKSGGFDPDYFLYWEDVDLSLRVQNAGGRLAVDTEAEAIHDEGGTHGQRLRWRAKSETYYYYNIRNRLIYAAKHVNEAQRRNWMRVAPRVSYEILLQGGRAQFLLPWIPVRALVKGIRDGRRFIRANA
ncbi:MAG TPA: glycosyltransferase family 2 protein [Pseudolysinimonas sp.]|nr:glycosyltransferase family 2 protein [Pseudolysinimonas sp.]